jgi:Ion channel
VATRIPKLREVFRPQHFQLPPAWRGAGHALCFHRGVRMLRRLVVACCLMAGCVTIHAAGLALAFRWLRQWPPRARFLSATRLFILVAVWIVLLHTVEIAVWGAAYTWTGAMPDLQTAFYFSAVTYTTTGYGDLVLPPRWRLDGAIEALTGILMCGWSTGFFFAIVNRLYEPDARATHR